MDSHDAKAAVYGRTRTALPHTEGGKTGRQNLYDNKYVTFPIPVASQATAKTLHHISPCP